MRTFNEDEVKKMANILSASPQITHKLAYYNDIINRSEELIKAIDKLIIDGYRREFYKILGIPVRKSVPLTDHERATLLIERADAAEKIWAQRQYLEHWQTRAKTYEAEFDRLSNACNSNFEQVCEKASAICASDPKSLRLRSAMSKWDSDSNENKSDQKTKNEYYLFLLQEIINHEKRSGVKGNYRPEVQRTA